MTDREIAEVLARVIVADIRAEQLEKRESGQVANINLVATGAPTRSDEQSFPETVGEDRFA